MSQAMENIIKQGYLMIGNSGGKRFSVLLKKIEGQSRKWFVFTIQQSIPYLEYYDNDMDVFSHRPINSYCLSQCRSITTLGRSNPQTFSISCDDRYIMLIASSRSQMLEWIHDLETSLFDLGLLKQESTTHVYSVLPAVVRQPRVSQKVINERQVSARSSSTLPHNQRLDDLDDAPPLPQRPTFLVSPATDRSSVLEPISITDTTPTDFADDTIDLLAVSPISGCNDEDFVSWDVVMQVRENFLKNNNLSETDVEEENLGATFSQNTQLDRKDNNLNLDSRKPMPDLFLHEKTAPVEFDFPLEQSIFSNTSIPDRPESGIEEEPTRKVIHVHENEYSLLPGSIGNEEETNGTQEESIKTPDKPIPTPRRTLFEKNDLRLENKDMPDSERFRTLNPSSETTSLDLPFHSIDKENHTFSHLNFLAEGSKNKDENENFSDSALEKFCLDLPPSIPVRSDSLPVPTTSTSVSSVCNAESVPLDSQQHFSSISSLAIRDPNILSSCTPKVMSCPSSKRCSVPLPPSVPPLPLLRNTSTRGKCSPSLSLDIPPMLPCRKQPPSMSLTEDCPPALPARNHKSCHLKSHSTGAKSISESYRDTSFTNEQKRQLTLSSPVSSMSEKSAALGSQAFGKSDLAKKMLLDRANSIHTVVSLKQTQADMLQAEINRSHICVTLTRKSGHGLALVDWKDWPCVVGWDQKHFPSLHGKLHIGDMLISVNNIRVSSSGMAQKLLCNASEPEIEVALQRIPYAKVFTIMRNGEGQSLGFKREGGTGEILYVDPNGLAAQHGLPQYAPGTIGKLRCRWFLTEINSRPLNLFFKANEIEHRLQAVGKEISIVVQPSDFIQELRRGLKALKHYKDFIIQ